MNMLMSPVAPSHSTGGETIHRDPELWQASQQFETLLWQQMITAMRKTVPESDLIPNGFAEDIYTGMFNEALSKVASTHTTLGLAEQIYRQFSGVGVTPEIDGKIKGFGHLADDNSLQAPRAEE